VLNLHSKGDDKFTEKNMTLKKQIRGITPKKILLGKQEYEYMSQLAVIFTQPLMFMQK
jgi:hypothetical protein